MRGSWVVCASVLVIATTSPSAAQTTRPVVDAQRSAQLAGSVNSAPKNMKVRFSMGLVRPEREAQAALRSVSDPASAEYRKFPTRSAIKSKYGIQKSVLAPVRSNVRAAGLTLSLDDTGVFVTVKGTVAKMSKWLSAPIRVRRANPRGLHITMLTTQGRPPKAIRQYVTEFVAMDVKVSGSSNLSYEGRNEGTPKSCLPGRAPDLSEYTYSFNQLRSVYGIDTLPASKELGAKTRVTVMGQGEGFSRQALASSAKCFGLPKLSISRVSVPGLSIPLPVGTEGNLDVQVVQAVLPAGSKVTVVESAAYDLRDFLSYATAYSRKHLPHVATTSYGYCERDLRHLPRGTVDLTESVLTRMSLAGTTLFSASGDRGSSDCINNATGKGPKRRAVDYPSSSPYMVAVGGTRISLNKANERTAEVVWNASQLQPPLGPEKLAGGGGTSIRFARPWWQDGIANWRNRSVPDIAAHAAGSPGWPLFTTDDGDQSVAVVGGTSATAPFIAATVGVMAAHQGRPFGQLQPALYSMPNSAFYDVTEGSNDLFGQGCCRAGVGFDRATGLGVPRFERWLQDLPPAR